MESLNYPGLLGLNLTITTQESEFLINIWKLFLDVWLAIQPQGSGQAAATNLSFSSRFCNIFVNTILQRFYSYIKDSKKVKLFECILYVYVVIWT